jgi:hypothetical protein
MADDIETAEAPLSPEDRTMAAIDAALEPIFRALSSPQPAHSSHLIALARSFRQALAVVVHGAPDPAESTGESLDMLSEQRRAQREANVDKAEPQFLPAPTEDKPEDEPDLANLSEYDKAKARALEKA